MPTQRRWKKHHRSTMLCILPAACPALKQLSLCKTCWAVAYGLWTLDYGLWTLIVMLHYNCYLGTFKMPYEGKHMQHQPARLNSSCPRGRPCQELGQGQEQLAVAVRQDTALRLAQGPAARLLGLLGLLWPLGLLLLLVMLLLLIRAMSICTTAAPTTSVLGATAPTTTITTTRASAILPPATTTTLLLEVRRDHRPPSRQRHLQARSPLVNSGQVELEWFPLAVLLSFKGQDKRHLLILVADRLDLGEAGAILIETERTC